MVVNYMDPYDTWVLSVSVSYIVIYIRVHDQVTF
jgi:hypothetical protein